MLETTGDVREGSQAPGRGGDATALVDNPRTDDQGCAGIAEWDHYDVVVKQLVQQCPRF